MPSIAIHLNFEILIPCCSVHFAVHNGAIQFAIACIIHMLRESKDHTFVLVKNRSLASHICVF